MDTSHLKLGVLQPFVLTENSLSVVGRLVILNVHESERGGYVCTVRLSHIDNSNSLFACVSVIVPHASSLKDRNPS